MAHGADTSQSGQPAAVAFIQQKRKTAHAGSSYVGAADDEKLISLGYTPSLVRDLTTFNLFGLTLSVIAVTTPVVATYGSSGLKYGGPVVVFWGWLIFSIFSMLIALPMAEVASAYPTSAGELYYLSLCINHGKGQKFVRFMAGGLNTIGSVTLAAGVAHSLVQLASQMVLLGTGTALGGGVHLSSYAEFGLYVVILLLCGAVNTCSIRTFAWVISIATFWNLVACPVYLIALPALNPDPKPFSYVVTEWYPNTEATGLSNPLHIFLTGMLFSGWTSLGYDASFHCIEEGTNAQWSGPISIIAAVLVTSLTGFLGIITLGMATVGDISRLFSPDTVTGGNHVAVQITWDAMFARFGSGSGTNAMLSVPFISNAFEAIMCVFAASRMVFAYSRDGALPFSEHWSDVDRRLKVPLKAVWMIVFLAILLGLPLMYSEEFFVAITSVCTVSLYLAYSLPLLFRVLTRDASFTPGPFYMGPGWGRAMSLAACIWTAFITVIFCMPDVDPVEGVWDINWTPVVLALVVILLAIWYFWPNHGAKKAFTSPVDAVPLVSSGILVGMRAPSQSQILSHRQRMRQYIPHVASAASSPSASSGTNARSPPASSVLWKINPLTGVRSISNTGARPSISGSMLLNSWGGPGGGGTSKPSHSGLGPFPPSPSGSGGSGNPLSSPGHKHSEPVPICRAKSARYQCGSSQGSLAPAATSPYSVSPYGLSSMASQELVLGSHDCLLSTGPFSRLLTCLPAGAGDAGLGGAQGMAGDVGCAPGGTPALGGRVSPGTQSTAVSPRSSTLLGRVPSARSRFFMPSPDNDTAYLAGAKAGGTAALALASQGSRLTSLEISAGMSSASSSRPVSGRMSPVGVANSTLHSPPSTSSRGQHLARPHTAASAPLGPSPLLASPTGIKQRGKMTRSGSLPQLVQKLRGGANTQHKGTLPSAVVPVSAIPRPSSMIDVVAYDRQASSCSSSSCSSTSPMQAINGAGLRVLTFSAATASATAAPATSPTAAPPASRARSTSPTAAFAGDAAGIPGAAAAFVAHTPLTSSTQASHSLLGQSLLALQQQQQEQHHHHHHHHHSLPAGRASGSLERGPDSRGKDPVLPSGALLVCTSPLPSVEEGVQEGSSGRGATLALEALQQGPFAWQKLHQQQQQQGRHQGQQHGQQQQPTRTAVRSSQPHAQVEVEAWRQVEREEQQEQRRVARTSSSGSSRFASSVPVAVLQEHGRRTSGSLRRQHAPQQAPDRK